jgi:hypothetical protein
VRALQPPSRHTLLVALSHGQGLVQPTSSPQVYSRARDDEFLEAASCLVRPENGDAILIFPDVFHRTQDIVVTRLAFITEAF